MTLNVHYIKIVSRETTLIVTHVTKIMEYESR